MMQEKPLFMNNKEWYYFDDEEWCYKLTELGASIPDVKASYEDFYKEV